MLIFIRELGESKYILSFYLRTVKIIAWERDRESGYYRWHHVEIDIFRTLPLSWDVWFIAGSSTQRVPPTPTDCRIQLWLTSRVETSVISYFSGPHIFSFRRNSPDSPTRFTWHFCCLLFKTQVPILFLNPHLTWPFKRQYVTKLLTQTELFRLGMATSLGEENLWIKTSLTLLKAPSTMGK